MKALITGTTGFAGGHLAELLLEQGEEVWGCNRSGRLPEQLHHLEGQVRLVACDLTDAASVVAFLREAGPETIYHLAALADPAACRRDPEAAQRVNVEGTRNLYEAMVRLELPARVLYVSTSHVYGQPVAEDLPLKESAPLQSSDDPYSATKLEADRLSRGYTKESGLHIVIVRAFHQVGPRRPAGYAISSWAQQIAGIEAGRLPPIVRVGNLESRRDYTDVRDVVRGYQLALQRGENGEVFNLGSGVSRRAGDILKQLLALSMVDIRVEVDPGKLRTSDPGEIVTDASHLREATGWRPQIPFKTTLRDTLDDWRGREGRER